MTALSLMLRRSFVLCLLFAATTVRADDWPTYLKSNARVGAVAESLAFPLSRQWIASPSEAPEKSWPGPQNREFEKKKLRSRMTFDDAFHVAIVGDRLFYGSSVDHQMRCVDLTSGEVVWTFFSEGPIRLAPTVFDGRVYFGSDDGHAYCVDAADGVLVWKQRPGPDGSRLLGRQQMISRWPVRTGIAVQADDQHGAVAYFGAGIFPHEVVFLYAVNAATGELIWKVDNISQTEAARNDLSPQGYLLTTDEILVVPSGRSLPAVVDRSTGELMHKKNHSWRRDAGGVVGGTQALLADGQIYAWGAHHVLAMDQAKGDVGFGWFAGHQLTVAGDAAYAADGTHITRLDRDAYAVASRERHKLELDVYNWGRALGSIKDKAEATEMKAKIAGANDRLKALQTAGIVWSVDSACESRLIVAGDQLIAGGVDSVIAYDTETGAERWRETVSGEAGGLAVANGKLIVSTTSGDVVCFGSGKARPKPAAALVENPYPQDELTGVYAEAAQKIIDASGVTRGFCLVVGNEEGRLAFELAQRSDLEICAVEPDRAKVDSARRKLASAGYYGARISIHHGTLSDIPYANYFANLVVSDTLVKSGEFPDGIDAEKLATKIKPLGGTAVVDADHADALSSLGLAGQATTRSENGLALLERGALPGAGSWSHQYGEAGNTACSYDYRVKGGLGVLWFGDPGEGDMVNRHEGAVAPLAINGRLIAQGQSRIMAYDAYNGLFLWARDNPDSIRTGVFQNQNPGNLVASDDSLFFMEKEVCVELDAASGKEIARHQLPETVRGGNHEWGYVSYKDGILFGSSSVREEIEERARRRGRATQDSTDGVFAIDVASGKLLWHYTGKTIEHQTIAIGDDTVYFIDSSITADQRQAILNQDKSRFENLNAEQQKAAEAELKKQDLRLAVAINSRSGEKLWEKAVDVTDCSDIGIGGGKLSLLFRNNVLLLCGANANGHYWKQFMDGEFEKRRLVALSGDNGTRLWAKDGNYRHRPIIIEDEIIAEPWAYDLYTGKQKTRQHPLTGEDVPWSMMRSGHHCGMIAGTPNLLTFRSGFTGFYDLEQDIGTRHFAGHRTGCWINAIPANGLISIPESSAGCVCLFSIASTIVMEPVAERQDWAMFSSVGDQLPVKSMALNLGAPGDRRDAKGTPWIAYPRPRPDRTTSLDLGLNISPAFAEGGGFTSVNSDSDDFEATTATADKAGPDWLYASAAEGLLMARIPLLAEGDAPAKYRVRLHMLSPESGAGERQFKLRLQGKAVGEGIAVSNQSRVPQVLEFEHIEVKDLLVVEQLADGKSVPKSQLPVLNGIEIVREE